MLALPAGEVDLAGQAEQVDSSVAPVAAENLPAGQSEHGGAWVTPTVKSLLLLSCKPFGPDATSPEGISTSVDPL
jgi:hypothetical protein